DLQDYAAAQGRPASCQFIQTAGPSLAHVFPLSDEFCAVVTAAEFFIGRMRQVARDDIRGPAQMFSNHGASRCTETMTSDLLLGVVTHSTQGDVDGVFADIPAGFRAA